MAIKRTKREFKELRTEHDFRLNEAYIREDLLPTQKIISINRVQRGHEVLFETINSEALSFQNQKVRTNVQLLEFSATKNLIRTRIPFVDSLEVYISYIK